MDEVTRRSALKAAAVAGGVLAVAGAAGADEKPEGGVASSGVTAVQPVTAELKLDTTRLKPTALAGGFQSLVGRITPDGSPGRNVLIISGLPAGTRVITVWMTEWAGGNQPHAGGAFFYTTSVQLYENGTKCRVVFNLDWGSHLATAAQVIYGPG